MGKQKFTIKVRRGLQWVEQVASAQPLNDMAASQRSDIGAALQWITENNKEPAIAESPAAEPEAA